MKVLDAFFQGKAGHKTVRPSLRLFSAVLPLDLDLFSLAELEDGELSFAVFFLVFFLGVSSSSSSSSSVPESEKEKRAHVCERVVSSFSVLILQAAWILYLSSSLERSSLSSLALSPFPGRLCPSLVSFSSPSFHLWDNVGKNSAMETQQTRKLFWIYFLRVKSCLTLNGRTVLLRCIFVLLAL